jgi:cellulose synthase/poly-beta-1,6-N-acetylglucosamine synthase-like glycosyltransferase
MSILTLKDVLLFPFFMCYALCVAGLILHSISFVFFYLLSCKYQKEPLTAQQHYADDKLPFQIIQLPVYNENVPMVKKLLKSACTVSYPPDRLLIQLLDDSDDEEISDGLQHMIDELNKRYPDTALHYYHRRDRRDFKAGNLNFGLQVAARELGSRITRNSKEIIVSIFDADFIIPSEYLNETVHYFTAPDVGAVQTFLQYYNRNHNSLTRAQSAYLINLHRIEFATRGRAGHLTTCRGSAGSWRLKAIEEAGGWRGDSQVEDVDMSFAAQLKGWKILYLDHIATWCQLPVNYSEFKLQQRSWMKGIMEVFRKWGRAIVKSTNLKFTQKLLAFDFFLVLSFQSVFIIVGHLTLIPGYYFLSRFNQSHWVGWITIGMLVLLCMTHFPFLVGEMRTDASKNNQTLDNFQHRRLHALVPVGLIPSLFPALTYGIFEGLVGLKVYRDRTIKPDLAGSKHKPAPSKDQRKLLCRIYFFESVMGIYSLLFVGWAFKSGEWALGCILSSLAVFYAVNAVISLKELVYMRNKAAVLRETETSGEDR